jgi:hypothetical protein
MDAVDGETNGGFVEVDNGTDDIIFTIFYTICGICLIRDLSSFSEITIAVRVKERSRGIDVRIFIHGNT